MKYPRLIVQDIRRYPLCLLSYENNLISNLEVRTAINEIDTLSFRVNANDFACQYLTNENLIEFEGEAYIIKNVKLIFCILIIT